MCQIKNLKNKNEVVDVGINMNAGKMNAGKKKYEYFEPPCICPPPP
jgi:hypothetical protein